MSGILNCDAGGGILFPFEREVWGERVREGFESMNMVMSNASYIGDITIQVLG